MGNWLQNMCPHRSGSSSLHMDNVPDSSPLTQASNDPLTQASNEWEIIQTPIIQAPNHKFRKAVIRVIKLLIIRKIWARIGSWLNTRAGRTSRRQRIISQIWHRMSTSHIQPHSTMFHHVIRRRGRLCYKWSAVWTLVLVIVRFSLRGLEPSPMGLDSSLRGLDSSLRTFLASPLRLESSPLRLEPSPLRLESSPPIQSPQARVRSSPNPSS